MQQIIWETVFNRQFEQVLDAVGIDRSDLAKVDSLKKQLNITRRSSCQLIVEVDENWKDKLLQILKNDNSAHQ
jgi:hypothetical protein